MTPAPLAAPGPVSNGEGGPVPPGEPRKLAHGSLYQTADGGFVLAYQVDGDDSTHHRHVPAAIVNMMATGANPLAVLRALLKGG